MMAKEFPFEVFISSPLSPHILTVGDLSHYLGTPCGLLPV